MFYKPWSSEKGALIREEKYSTNPNMQIDLWSIVLLTTLVRQFNQNCQLFLWIHPQAHGSESRGKWILLTLIKQIKEF